MRRKALTLPKAEQPTRRFGVWFLLLGIWMAGGILRLYFSGEPLWIDELHTAWSVQGSFADVSIRAGQGNQTPLYFWIVFCVGQTFGIGAYALRAVSMLSGMLVVLLLSFHLVRRFHSYAAAVAVSTILGSDATLVFYGSEARPYALWHLSVLVQVLLYLRLIEDQNHGPERRLPLLLGLGLTNCFLVLTHLAAFPLLLTEFLILVSLWQRIAVRWSMLLTCAIPLLCVPYLWPLIHQVLANRSSWSGVSNDWQPARQLVPVFTCSVVVPLAGIAVDKYFLNRYRSVIRADDSAYHYREYANSSGRQRIGVLLLLVVIPIAFLIGMQKSGAFPASNFRYVSYAPVLLGLFLGESITCLRNRQWRATMAIASATLFLIFNPICNSWVNGMPVKYRLEDWKSTVSRVNQKAMGKPAVVFLFANLVEDRLIERYDDEFFVRYLKFPMQAVYRSDSQIEVIPMPTLVTETPWSAEQITRIQTFQLSLAVTRVDDQTRARIFRQLVEKAKRYGISLKCTTELQSHNRVALTEIQVVPDSANTEN